MRLGKSLAGIGAIILIGAGVLFFIQYLDKKNSPEKKTEEAMRQLEKAYREDPYGGITPEETLQLFIDALKKEDTDLAAKYFVLDKQEEMKVDLDLVKQKELLEALIKDFERANRGNDINENSTIFIVTNENKEVITVINIARIPKGKWKIVDF